MFNPISNNEKQFILENLVKNNIREGERGSEDYRNISIKKLDENGQCEVKLGDTLIISQIFAKLVNPNKERPNEGIIVFSV
jgi:exosome complex RNA-binding protein Rrp42 (RNase PH superfamily)